MSYFRLVIILTHLIPTALQTSDRTLGTEEGDNLWTLQGKAKGENERNKTVCFSDKIALCEESQWLY